MNKPVAVSILAASLLAGGADAANPGLLDLAMPDAKVLMGVQVRRILASPFGESLQAQLGAQAPEMAQLIAATGFDPFGDLEEILIASPGGNDAPSLLAVRGSFDPVVQSQRLRQSGRVLDVVDGIEVFTGLRSNKDGPPQGWAFLDATTVIAGDLARLRDAIRNRHVAAALDPEIRREIGALSARYDVWVVAETPSDALAGRLPSGDSPQAPQAMNLQSMRRFSGGLRFSPDMEIAAELLARSEKDAAELAGAMRILAGLFQAQQAKQGGRPGPNLLERLQISVDGGAVRLALTIPEAELREALERHAARAATAPARPSSPPKVAPGRNPNEIIIQSSPKDMGTVVIPVPNKP